jgi:uncharacterized protein (TIGR02594 family)
VIQSPDNAQSWNPYSYCLNNPLTYTDPTGMMSWRQVLGTVFAIVATVFAPEGAGFWYSVFVGAVAGGISTGTWQGALYGAFSAGLFYGIGNYFQNAQWAQATNGNNAFGSGLTWGGYGAKVLAHGIAGGVMNVLYGGKFGSGFAAAGFTEAVSPGLGHIDNDFAQGFVASIVGGTASVLTGGKFANGAMTAAFSYAFNHWMHDDAADVGSVQPDVNGTPWLDVAADEVGQAEVAGLDSNNPRIVEYLASVGVNGPDETAWCSAFTNWVFGQVGITGTNSAWALNWRSWPGGTKLSRPAYGSLAVIKWPKGGGHVGFVVGQTASGSLVILGGNQGNYFVKYSVFSRNLNMQFVYPAGYTPSYELPVLKLDGSESFKSTR